METLIIRIGIFLILIDLLLKYFLVKRIFFIDNKPTIKEKIIVSQKKLNTLEELSHSSFYSMEKYSQLVIDLISDVEDLPIELDEDTRQEATSMSYLIYNIIEICDKSKTHDFEALMSLNNILGNRLKNYVSNEKK